MRLKERKLDIDACKSTFFDAIDSDLEFSLAVAKLDFSNKWAEEQQTTTGEATNEFVDDLRLQAEPLDSVEGDKNSGRAARRASAHIADDTTSVDESSQESVDAQDDEDLSDTVPHPRAKILTFRAMRRNVDPELTIPSLHCKELPQEVKKML